MKDKEIENLAREILMKQTHDWPIHNFDLYWPGLMVLDMLKQAIKMTLEKTMEKNNEN